jgi:hypothetical protein
VEGTSQAVLGSSDQLKVTASLSLFLKSEKIPALLYLGKRPEYNRPFCDFQPVPSAYRPWTQISNHERAPFILFPVILGGYHRIIIIIIIIKFPVLHTG